MEREYSSIIEQSLIILGLQEPSNLLKRIIHRFDMNEEMIDQMKNIGELEDRFKTLAINRKLDYVKTHYIDKDSARDISLQDILDILRLLDSHRKEINEKITTLLISIALID